MIVVIPIMFLGLTDILDKFTVIVHAEPACETAFFITEGKVRNIASLTR